MRQTGNVPLARHGMRLPFDFVITIWPDDRAWQQRPSLAKPRSATIAFPG